MKLLLVSHSSGFYGAEKSLLTVAKGLKKFGHEVIVVLPSEGQLAQKLSENDIPCKIWRYYGWLGRNNQILKGCFRLIFNIISCLVFCFNYRQPVDLIYTNTITTPFGAFVAILKRKKHIWHVREFVHEDMGAKFDLGKTVSRYVYFSNHKYTIFNSFAVSRKFFSYFGEHNSAVIYNAIGDLKLNEERLFAEIDADSKVKLLMVSSLHPGKGHMDALMALPYVVKEYPKVQLEIVGAGDCSYKKYLKRYIADHGLEKNIVFRGYVDDPVGLMTESDVFLMCSRNEAFGRVTLEAMAAGCPVIGANSGGTAEILGSGKYGVVYQVGNYEDLGRKVVKMLSEKNFRVELSQAGLVRSKEFSAENMLNKLEKKINNSH